MKRTQREYRVIDFPPLTDEERATLERLNKMPDSEINFSDIPPSNPNSNGGFYYIGCSSVKVKVRERSLSLSKPIMQSAKEETSVMVTVRVEPEPV